jgi:hypothetical protein
MDGNGVNQAVATESTYTVSDMEDISKMDALKLLGNGQFPTPRWFGCQLVGKGSTPKIFSLQSK